MPEILQRWRCPDCNLVTDVWVDESTGQAAEMKDELCPNCLASGLTRLCVLDLAETALIDGDPDKDPCMRCGSTGWRQRDYSGCSDCRDESECERGCIIPTGARTCLRCGRKAA